MTGPEFLAYVKRDFKRDDKDTELYEAATDTIQDFRNRFSFEDDKEDSSPTDVITVLGDYRIDLDSDFGMLVSDVRVIDGNQSWPLIPLDKAEYDLLYPNQDATNAPQQKPIHFIIFNNKIYLGPVPGSTSYTYKLSFSKGDVTAIGSGTSSVPFSSRYREALKCGTMMRAHRGLQDFMTAGVWGQLADAEFKKVKDREIKNTKGVLITNYRDVC